MIKRDDATQRIHSCPLRMVIVQGTASSVEKEKKRGGDE